MIKTQVRELEQLKGQYDIFKRATTSFESEREDLEKGLGTIKKDFAVDAKPIAYLYVFFGILKRRGKRNLVSKISQKHMVRLKVFPEVFP